MLTTDINGFTSTIHIHITTYQQMKPVKINHKESTDEMYSPNNKFTCPFCLNTRQELRMVNKENGNIECPFCKKYFIASNHIFKKEVALNCPDNEYKISIEVDVEKKAKYVQTSLINAVEGFDLLNEVLEVFKDKRNSISDKKSKTYKDVCVCTTPSSGPRLTISKTCNISINNNSYNNADKSSYIVIHSSEPVNHITSNCSRNLLKHKSSSIPQMKIEELKYSLKEKSSSKDTIQEVNRMFATMKTRETREIANFNRPNIRNGPRLLPVVSNTLFPETNNLHCSCNKETSAFSCGDGGNVNPRIRYYKNKSDNHENEFINLKLDTCSLICGQCKTRLK